MATVIYKDLATSTQKRNRFEIPLLAAILGTKFPKEQSLVHKTTNLCATQNNMLIVVALLYFFLLSIYLQAGGQDDLKPNPGLPVQPVNQKNPNLGVPQYHMPVSIRSAIQIVQNSLGLNVVNYQYTNPEKVLFKIGQLLLTVMCKFMSAILDCYPFSNL